MPMQEMAEEGKHRMLGAAIDKELGCQTISETGEPTSCFTLA
ncbi:hypothetical protein GGP56_003401 [Salinibacter ruber]|nr:hypothetical protein [Salinibacter ruber]